MSFIYISAINDPETDFHTEQLQTYAIDTHEQVEIARAALRNAGQSEAFVYVGEPDDPDHYRTGSVLFADFCLLFLI